MKRIRALVRGSEAAQRIRVRKWIAAHPREAQKFFNFGLNYGTSGRRLQGDINMDNCTSGELMEKFKKSFPAFVTFTEEIARCPRQR